MKKHMPAVLWLALATLCAALGTAACLALGVRTRAADYEVKLIAAQKMQACMDAVKAYKAQEGLALSDEDWFETGMLGDRLTEITTTLGILEAKRTTANSDMAALAVQLLTEAGVRRGDRVAAGCSGSFPSLNLALLSACDAMGVECVYITSAGASSYGANQPALTFPEMACRLVDDGLLPAYPTAVSAGGQNDMGQDMDAAALASIREQLSHWPVTFISEEDYTQNIRLRESLYGAGGPLACFVAVGGGLVTIGRNDAQFGQGIIQPDRIGPLNAGSGLLERYSAAGLPVIEFLNIKKLVADYDLAYDPQTLPEPGESAVYHTVSRPRWPAWLGLLAAVGCLLAFRRAAARQKGAAL